MRAGTASRGSTPTGDPQPRTLFAGVLAAVAALVGGGVLALARPPGTPDEPGAGYLRSPGDADRITAVLRQPGLDIIGTVSLRNDTILVNPPYDTMSHIDAGVAATIATEGLGRDAIVRCRFGTLSFTDMDRGTFEQAVPVWMCVQVAPALTVAGGLPHRLVAVSFVDAVDGHRLLDLREPA